MTQGLLVLHDRSNSVGHTCKLSNHSLLSICRSVRGISSGQCDLDHVFPSILARHLTTARRSSSTFFQGRRSNIFAYAAYISVPFRGLDSVFGRVARVNTVQSGPGVET